MSKCTLWFVAVNWRRGELNRFAHNRYLFVINGSGLKAESHLPFLILVHLQLYVFYFISLFAHFSFIFLFWLFCWLGFFIVCLFVRLGFFLGFLLHTVVCKKVHKSSFLNLKWQFSGGWEWGREGCHSH